jgi:O-6-methylguanine DNA methyltransferase
MNVSTARDPGRTPGRGPTATRPEMARAIVAGLRSLREGCPDDVSAAIVRAVATVDSYAEMRGPIWPLLVAWGADGVGAIARADDPGAFEDEYRARTGRGLRRVERVPDSLARAVERRIRGGKVTGLSVDLTGLNEFQRLVLTKTMEIPHGEVRPYAWVAEEIGHPRAQRAVGTALAHNPIPFVIPCHRVVRSDGRIGNYGAGGPTAKRAVLASEGVDPDELERLAAAGIRYIGSDTTRIFCYPSCRHVRRISPRHQVRFRNTEETRRAGFRACRSCRPVDVVAHAA